MSIELKHIQYVYGQGTAYEKQALKDVSLEIPQGQFLGIIGHTGSGKSTLIQHFNGLIKAASGELYYEGKNIYEDGYDMKYLRSQVGLVFQYPEHQLFEVDVLTDVCLVRKIRGFQKKSARNGRKKLWNWLVFRKNYIYSLRLSFPEDRREGRRSREFLPCARKYWYWMNRLPDWIREDGMRFWIRLQSSQETGITVILVSHSMEDIAKYVDRIIVMNRGGKSFLDGRPREVFAHYQELEEVGLAAPQVTYIMHDLRQNGLQVGNDVTTVEEAADEIMRYFRGKHPEETKL